MGGGEGGFDAASLAQDAAVGPLDARVARRDVGLAHDDEAAFVPALSGEAADQGVDLRDEPLVHANDEMRHGAQMLKGRLRGVRDGTDRVHA